MLTGSAAILSDAAESVTHVAAVFFAAYSLRLSYRPPDKDHLYGHTKISFFSAGFEGAMIVLAALFIIYESIRKWMTGQQLENLGGGHRAHGGGDDHQWRTGLLPSMVGPAQALDNPRGRRKTCAYRLLDEPCGSG